MSTLLFKPILGFVVVLFAFFSPGSGADAVEAMRLLNKLTVAGEERCSPYERNKHYSYPQGIELLVAGQLGGILWNLYRDLLRVSL